MAPGRTAPYLRGFEMDMQNGLVTLAFSEPVFVITPNDTTRILLVSDKSSYRSACSRLDLSLVAYWRVSL